MESLFSQLHNSESLGEVLRNLLVILSAGNAQSEALKRLVPAKGIVSALIDLLKGQNYGLCETDGSGDTSGQGESSFGESSTSQDVIGRRSNDPLLPVLALGCLYHICDGPPSLYAKYVDKTFVSTLLSYFIPDYASAQETMTVNRFFQFGPSYTASVKDILSSSIDSDKVLVCIDEDCGVEVQPEKRTADSNQSSNLHKILETELRFYEPLLQAKSAHVKSCRVQIVKDADTINLADYLISKGAAWPQNNKMIAARERTETSTVPNISKYVPTKITKLLKGNFFWMIVGEEKIQLAEKVKNILLHHKAQLTNIVPQKLDAVAAVVKISDKDNVVRARVLDISGVILTVQDIDTGCMYYVSMCDIYSLPSSLNLTTVPPLATMAHLKGVLPVPLDVRAPELAAGALGLIVRHDYISAVNLILQSDVVDSLSGLVMCPDSEVAYRALELVVSLVSYRVQQVRVTPWYCLIPGALATLRHCMQKTIESRARLCAKKQKLSRTSQNTGAAEFCGTHSSQSDDNLGGLDCSTMKKLGITSNARNNALVESCVACLANCMFLSCKGKSHFYQNRGLETVIQAFVLYYNQRSIRSLCMKALANYVHFKKPTNFRLHNCRYKGTQRKSSLSKTTATQKALSEKKDGNVKNYESASQDEEADDAVAECFSSMDLHGSSSSSDDSIDGETVPKKYYIRGDKVPFSQDATHELQQAAKPGSRDFAAIICGMLNTGRVGTIYMGLDPRDMSVVGVSMDHDARDEMRMSVDHLMVEQLSPSVLHLQFHVEFVPVMEMPTRRTAETRPGADANGVSLGDANPALFHLGHEYVVEIQVKPLPNVIYCCSGNECFYRLGGQTVVLDCQLIRQLLVLEEEAEHVEHIVSLQQQVERLKTEVSMLC